MRWINKNTKILTEGIFILLSLIAYILIPTKNDFEVYFAAILFLLSFPLCYIFFISKESLKEVGFILGDYGKGIVFATISLILSTFILYIVYNYTQFVDNYVVNEGLDNFMNFIKHEFFVSLPLVFIYCFYFGVYLYNYFNKLIGQISLIIPFIVIIVLLFATKSFSWQFFPFVLFTLFNPFIVKSTKSILYPIVYNFLFLMMVDAVVISAALK